MCSCQCRKVISPEFDLGCLLYYQFVRLIPGGGALTILRLLGMYRPNEYFSEALEESNSYQKSVVKGAV